MNARNGMQYIQTMQQFCLKLRNSQEVRQPGSETPECVVPRN